MKWLEKTAESYNDYYKTYKAAWCRKSGLPMYSKQNFEPAADKLFSASRASKLKKKIKAEPAGWYKTLNGYVPLFEEIENG